MQRAKLIVGIVCIGAGIFFLTHKCSNDSGHHKDKGADLNCYYNQHQLYRGAQGGCFYYKGSEKKYVEKKFCNCN